MGPHDHPLEFGLDKDIDEAAGAVQAAINAAAPSLPKNMPGPPIYVKANPNGFPMIAIGLTSDVLRHPGHLQFADTVCRAKLSQIEGVAQVFLSGAAQASCSHPGQSPRSSRTWAFDREMQRRPAARRRPTCPRARLPTANHAVTLAANDQLYRRPPTIRTSSSTWKTAPRSSCAMWQTFSTAPLTLTRRLVQRRTGALML